MKFLAEWSEMGYELIFLSSLWRHVDDDDEDIDDYEWHKL
jgi:hypothetical protein